MRQQNLGILAVAAVCAGSAQAQWTAVRLHNSAFFGSGALAAAGDWQGGSAGVNGRSQPILWHASSNEWVNLVQNPTDNGTVFGMHGDSQVGSLNGHASLWSGIAGSRLDLHPGWAEGSIAYATDGTEQVGSAYLGSGPTARAALWRGSAASYVNLHPAGAIQSEATAVVPGLQGGYVEYPAPGGRVPHAALWSGSAASFVDLNPPGAEASQITGMWPGQQVGGAWWGGIGQVGYWSGTPESFVSLQPPNSSFVSIFGTCGSAQVGRAALPVTGHSAVIWFGSAESMVNLAAYLPPGQYFQSTASAVSFYDGRYYVAGWASDSVTHAPEAFLWIGVPAPGTFVALIAGGLSSMVLRARRPSAPGRTRP